MTGRVLKLEKLFPEAFTDKPEVICLCGSLRFKKEMGEAELNFVLQGHIVLTPCCMYVNAQRTDSFMEYKKQVDEIHKRKIDLCDFVYVVNVDGYIGESTRSEVDYAIKVGKPVKYFKAFDKPERVKRLFELEYDDFELSDITEKDIQECILTKKTILTVRNPTVTEVIDKADCTNPTPEREGLNVRIEYEKGVMVDYKLTPALLQANLNSFYNTTHFKNLSVKEIEAEQKLKLIKEILKSDK